jgi:hypothetical protein
VPDQAICPLKDPSLMEYEQVVPSQGHSHEAIEAVALLNFQ